MKRISQFFRNPFATATITDARLRVFTQAHLQRMKTADTNGLFTDYIADTQALYDGYFGHIQTEVQLRSQQKSATSTVNDVMTRFRDAVRSQVHTIASIFPEESATYREFFPNGITELSRLTRENAEAIMQRFAQTAETHKTKLGGATFAAKFSGFEAEYTAARNAQYDKIGGVRSSAVAATNTRQELELQLTKNAGWALVNYYNNPAQAEALFPFGLLFRARHSNLNTFTGKVAAHSLKNVASSGFSSANTFSLQNNGEEPITFYLSRSPETRTGRGITVQPFQATIVPFASFSVPDGNYLLIENGSDVEVGYEVKVLEV